MLKAIDLFSGCGGISLGLKAGGINIKWANELNHSACKTYAGCHRKTNLLESDIVDFISKLHSNEAGLPKPGEVDLVVGGPPCQGFSGYNRHRSPDDPRNSLVESFLEVVDYLAPSYLLMENVTGMLSLESGKTVKLLMNSFADLGYKYKLGILQAGYYGLPQNRWRIFILASRRNKTLPDFPPPTHKFPRTTIFGAKDYKENVVRPDKDDENLLPQVTVGDALSDLPRIANGGGDGEMDYKSEPKAEYQQILRRNCDRVYNHMASNLGPVMYKRVRAVPKRLGAGWLDLPEELKPRNLAKHRDKRYDNRFGRLHKSGTFNTIVSKPEPYWGRVIHPTQNRVISVREAARAQGFPDLVKFEGSIKEQYLQIGNAVPPILGKLIGLEIVKSAKK